MTKVYSAIAAICLFLGANTISSFAASSQKDCEAMKGVLAFMGPSMEQMAGSIRRLNDSSQAVSKFEGAERQALEDLATAGEALVAAMDVYVAKAEDAHYAMTVCAR